MYKILISLFAVIATFANAQTQDKLNQVNPLYDFTNGLLQGLSKNNFIPDNCFRTLDIANRYVTYLMYEVYETDLSNPVALIQLASDVQMFLDQSFNFDNCDFESFSTAFSELRTKEGQQAVLHRLTHDFAVVTNNFLYLQGCSYGEYSYCGYAIGGLLRIGLGVGI